MLQLIRRDREMAADKGLERDSSNRGLQMARREMGAATHFTAEARGDCFAESQQYVTLIITCRGR